MSPQGPVLVLVLICAVALLLMLYASFGDSAIMDELAHIPAGYGYANNLDYRLNPEHPPLIKALSALPLLFLRPNFPTDSPAWTSAINGQWNMGAKFLYESSNNADRIIRWARIAPILLTIFFIVFVYIFSRELLGKWWALLPTLLTALSPTILAHGHYVTTDVGAALGIIFALYYFLKFLNSPSRRYLIYAGLAFGVAMITKFSAVLLTPFFLFLVVVFYFASVVRDWPFTESGRWFRRFLIRGFRYLRSVAVIFFIGYVLVVYPIYFLFTINYPVQKQVSDTEYILTSYGGGQTPPGQTCRLIRCPADLTISLAKNPVTRPIAQYLLGVLMVLQRSVGGNTAYFMGEVSASGSFLYFPLIYLLKEPLPVLLLVFLALAITIAGMARKLIRKNSRFRDEILNYLTVNFAEFSMIVFVVLYWAYSVRSPLNIGFRHLLPTLPLIYILTAGVWKRWIINLDAPPMSSQFRNLLVSLKNIATASAKFVILSLLLLWLVAETALASPYFLSYFNQIGGGVFGGYRYVTDSNYDWGQDLLRLKKFVNQHPEIDKIAVDYFGGGDPKYYLGEKVVNWQPSKGNPSANENIRWLAVSINTLQGAIQKLTPGQTRNPQDEYGWLTTIRPPAPGFGNIPKPDFKVGTSIFIYKL